jgi:hypothetical protein
MREAVSRRPSMILPMTRAYEALRRQRSAPRPDRLDHLHRLIASEHAPAPKFAVDEQHQDGLEFSRHGWKSAPQGDNVALI